MKALERFKARYDEPGYSDANVAGQVGHLTGLAGLALDANHLHGQVSKRRTVDSLLNSAMITRDYESLFDRLAMNPKEIKSAIKSSLKHGFDLGMAYDAPKMTVKASLMKNLKRGGIAAVATYGGLKLADHFANAKSEGSP